PSSTGTSASSSATAWTDPGARRPRVAATASAAPRTLLSRPRLPGPAPPPVPARPPGRAGVRPRGAPGQAVPASTAAAPRRRPPETGPGRAPSSAAPAATGPRAGRCPAHGPPPRSGNPGSASPPGSVPAWHPGAIQAPGLEHRGATAAGLHREADLHPPRLAHALPQATVVLDEHGDGLVGLRAP